MKGRALNLRDLSGRFRLKEVAPRFWVYEFQNTTVLSERQIQQTNRWGQRSFPDDRRYCEAVRPGFACYNSEKTASGLFSSTGPADTT